MLRFILPLLSLVALPIGAHAFDLRLPIAPGASQPMLISDDEAPISDMEEHTGQSPRVRPQRYLCVIDQSGNIGGGGEVQCPSKPGRVGGKCRCPNVTGTGQLYTY